MSDDPLIRVCDERAALLDQVGLLQEFKKRAEAQLAEQEGVITCLNSDIAGALADRKALEDANRSLIERNANLEHQVALLEKGYAQCITERATVAGSIHRAGS